VDNEITKIKYYAAKAWFLQNPCKQSSGIYVVHRLPVDNVASTLYSTNKSKNNK